VTTAYDLTTFYARTGDGWGHAWGAGGGLWLFGLLMLLLWILLIAAVVWLVGRSVWPRERSAGDRAREILAERYARGELSSEEYRERIDQLK
jgi:putative membrane protein